MDKLFSKFLFDTTEKAKDIVNNREVDYETRELVKNLLAIVDTLQKSTNSEKIESERNLYRRKYEQANRSLSALKGHILPAITSQLQNICKEANKLKTTYPDCAQNIKKSATNIVAVFGSPQESEEAS